MKKKDNKSELKTKNSILSHGKKLHMLYDVDFLSNEDKSFNVRDKIILDEFVHSIASMSDIHLDPAIIESANKLRKQIYSDCGKNMITYKKLRNDIISKIDSRFHVN